ncbi:MAG TPA: TIGR00282 family metallophosphoesterase [Desulfobacteria bacterium]|nr:TIGR00282 family metallophosphoesterase [Desulfobacteria bacterium]
MNILFIGDIVGRPGRTIVKKMLREIQQEYKINFTIVNAENAAGGNGVTKEIAEELYQAGVNCLTTGNHVWDKRQVFEFIDQDKKIIRPANYPAGVPGKGYTLLPWGEGDPVAVINLSGRVYMPPLDDPFQAANRLVTQVSAVTKTIFVDFHAEATSEKIALGWFLDGRVSAVCGTHTHVQTADERILPGGTAYISDAGMTGPRDSVLGVNKEIIITKFLTQLPARFEVAGGVVQLNGVVVDIDQATGKARSIQRVQKFIHILP